MINSSTYTPAPHSASEPSFGLTQTVKDTASGLFDTSPKDTVKDILDLTGIKEATGEDAERQEKRTLLAKIIVPIVGGLLLWKRGDKLLQLVRNPKDFIKPFKAAFDFVKKLLPSKG